MTHWAWALHCCTTLSLSLSSSSKSVEWHITYYQQLKKILTFRYKSRRRHHLIILDKDFPTEIGEAKNFRTSTIFFILGGNSSSSLVKWKLLFFWSGFWFALLWLRRLQSDGPKIMSEQTWSVIKATLWRLLQRPLWRLPQVWKTFIGWQKYLLARKNKKSVG